jgi:hypothetical protein
MSPIHDAALKLDTLANRIAQGQALESEEEWGGAGVVICQMACSGQSGEWRPDPRQVVTTHSLSLSWLFAALTDAFQGLIDHVTKFEFYGRLANAATRYQSRVPVESQTDLLLAVLNEAYSMLSEMEKGTFEYLEVAPGNLIADDLKDQTNDAAE